MLIIFEKKEKGLICCYPEDRGSWIVPANSIKQNIIFKENEIVEIEIVGVSKNGKLRFAKIIRNITNDQKKYLDDIKKATEKVATFENLVKKRWGKLEISSRLEIFGCYSKNEVCIDEKGIPAVSTLRVDNFFAVDCNKISDHYLYSPKITPKKPLALEKDNAQNVLAFVIYSVATGHSSAKSFHANFGGQFLEDLKKLTEAVKEFESRTGKEWYECQTFGMQRERWPVAFWLLDQIKKNNIFNFKDLMDRINIKNEIDEVKNNLKPLMVSMPSVVMFSDGKEREIVWNGNVGVVCLGTHEFSVLEVDRSDVRVVAIKNGGFSLKAETTWEVTEELDGYSAGQTYETVGYGKDTRKLI